ncbi:MAG: hypothetical protein ACI3Y7_07260 [Candidatus Cryptobacteroides sp.]
MLVKKYCRLALLPLLMLALFSCSKQQPAVQESDLSLSLVCEQDFLFSKAGEGSVSADSLYYLVYAEGESVPLFSAQTAFNPSGTTDLKIRLFKDKPYVLAFWAYNSAAGYTVTERDGTVTFPSNPAANDANLDAFYAKASITGGQGSLSVSLKRAVAKVSVSLSLSNALTGAASSSLSFDSAYRSFSLLDGEVSDLSALNFSSASCPGTQNVAYTYIFAPQNQAYSCTMTLKVFDSSDPDLLSTTLNNIPVQRNIQTNITYNN